MNFLTHSLISLEIDTQTKQQTLYGNFAGDFYKGLIPHLNLADNLKSGVVLHRSIDKISDRPDSLTTQLLQGTFGRYKGIVSDIMIDHFLAKHFQRLFAKDLNEVQAQIFQQIEQQRTIFPEQFVPMFNWLQSRKALTHYADLDFLEQVFLGMSSRVKKGEILRNAVTEIWQNYTLLEEAAIQEFFTVKDRATRERS
ncbi:acyl carrier protein phosphodiesterase [Mannheimia haemolytica]|uniref:acyl carrier protein phosphodiesterase n=1 Tax=Mannheimia haemolytica TaxID=75985 RepID=UPI001ADD32E4|nr:ACP phosphodiesterase [Mannheimia haemolytica]UQX79980.1 acyl carrier protein phosphodiesterase [Mannheimia haemolytica]